NVVDESGAVHRGYELDAQQFGTDDWHRLYATADGYICVSCNTETERGALATALGVQAGDDVAAQVAAALAGMTSDDAFALLDGAGVPCEIAVPDPQMPDLLWDEWLAETSRVLEQHHPHWGWIREIGVLVH
ncbi:MAG TPA: hypothetical protein PLV68_15825, partial [Ilumatobacteraceae bacterium]|nr:hypothetical protein [Ilumatobacteraceae bacterium]